MKKIIALILMLAMSFCFVSCSHECAVCGKDADNKYEDEYLCDDCHELAQLGEELNDLLN